MRFLAVAEDALTDAPAWRRAGPDA